MQDLKISLITVTLNAEKTLDRCIRSVIAQNYPDIEHIIIDGGSTDGTSRIIDEYKTHIDLFISEPDKGIYDAMNKGIEKATGQVIGILNADDFFAADDVLSSIATAFQTNDTAIVYGNLDYVDPQDKIIRKWYSGAYKEGLFNWGWMPPHPTFYCKRSVFKQLGKYDLQYDTAADYELMLRFIHLNKVTVHYLNKTLVKMGLGGVSNKNYRNRLKAWRFDLRAMRNNGVVFPLLCIALKPLRKIVQFF